MKHIHTEKAPKAVGPYSQAIVSGGFVFCSGQIGIDPEAGKITGETTIEQTHQVIKNLQAVLETAGSSLKNVVKTTCYLRHIEDYQVFNTVYSEYFGESKPARAAVEVSNLPLGALVEIEAVAELANT